MVLLLGIGAVYYAYQRGRKFGLVDSGRVWGEASNAKKVEMMDSGQLNGDKSIQETYAEPEAVGGGLRYFDEERLGTATD